MAEYLAPGVYLEEVPTGVRPIEGVDTSTTAFIGRARRGPVDTPVDIASFAAFESRFGGLAATCPMAYAVQQFFENGGKYAIIVRVRNGSRAITDAQIAAPELQAAGRGLWALDRVASFGLLCIPPLTFTRDVGKASWDAAARYCSGRGALLIVDAPRAWTSRVAMDDAALDTVITRTPQAALYFPRVLITDARDGHPRACAPCGMVAGVCARTDYERGVFKAPAGTHAVVHGALGGSVAVTDAEQEVLNPRSINVLRVFPQHGLLVWGARTLATQQQSEWRYVPVRRLHFYIEQSLIRGLEWTVFEPNDEALWTKLRATVGQFLMRLWRDGGLLGDKPEQAFVVHCGRNTMTQGDIDLGHVIIEIGYAPLKPAEFLILRLTLKSVEYESP